MKRQIKEAIESARENAKEENHSPRPRTASKGAARERHIDYCHTFRGTYIPGCYGGAFFGRSKCTCEKSERLPTFRRDSVEARLGRMEKMIVALTKTKFAPLAPFGGRE